MEKLDANMLITELDNILIKYGFLANIEALKEIEKKCWEIYSAGKQDAKLNDC